MVERALQELAGLAEMHNRSFKLLIVDDEPWVRDTLLEFCNLSHALTVDTADNGTEAIRKLSQERYDLITVDLIMPELSGLDVLMEARRVAPEVPLILITGNATDKLVYEAGLMGACKVLYKPVDLELFMSEMAGVIGRKEKSGTN